MLLEAYFDESKKSTLEKAYTLLVWGKNRHYRPGLEFLVDKYLAQRMSVESNI